jgi:hypothetical protein
MANRGYDVVVDVDQEVRIYFDALGEKQTEDSSADNPPGRPRPHRPPRRPRIPQLQCASTSPSPPFLTQLTKRNQQTSTRSPHAAHAAHPKSNPTRHRSSPAPRQPRPHRANTTSGRSPSTRKPLMSTQTKSSAAVHLPFIRAQTSSTSSRGTRISTAPCGSRRPSLSSCS